MVNLIMFSKQFKFSTRCRSLNKTWCNATLVYVKNKRPIKLTILNRITTIIIVISPKNKNKISNKPV